MRTCPALSQQWSRQLAGWAILEHILTGAGESPWGCHARCSSAASTGN